MITDSKNIRPLVYWPDPLLKKKADPVTDFGSGLQELAWAMRDTMIHHRGLGLAAVQIGSPAAVLAIADVDPVRCGVEFWVNPRILETSDETEMKREGCLSLPGVYENVLRRLWVRVEGQFLDGSQKIDRLFGLRAHVFQHELDHLRGKVFPDRMDPGARDRIRALVRKNRGGR